MFLITIILVTHDPNVAGHARRNIRLRDGMIESDTTREGPAPTGEGDIPRRVA